MSMEGIADETVFRGKYRWQSVYYHHQKWCKNGSLDRIWQHFLDMSSIQLNGTHTSVKHGGQAVSFQGRKKAKTSNMLILTDSWGMSLACSAPIDGNHNNAYELVPIVKKMISRYSPAGFQQTVCSSMQMQVSTQAISGLIATNRK